METTVRRRRHLQPIPKDVPVITTPPSPPPLVTTRTVTKKIGMGVAIVVVLAGCAFLLAIAAFPLLGWAMREPPCAPGESDTAWGPPRVPAPGSSSVFTSHYLTMRDGVRIAVDVNLPEAWKPGAAPLPTILHFTKYYRRWRVRWPFSLSVGDSFNMRSRAFASRFLAAGYAWVSVDMRGTGASTGQRSHDMNEDEKADQKEILEWVIRKPWCNGRIGSTGISYDAMMGLLLLAHGHPAVRAIAPLFSAYDVYRDIVFPGGILNTGFVDNYSPFVMGLDRNDLSHVPGFPWSLKVMMIWMLEGPYPVEGDTQTLKAALQQHHNNWDLAAGARDVLYRDDPGPPECGGVTLEMVSVHSFREQIEASGVPIYSFSGWYDAATARSAIHQFLELGDGRAPHRLTLGPWQHGARKTCSPFAPHNTRCFDLEGELIQFFDRYLKITEDETREEESPPVHYFTMGAEAEVWHEANEWPPSASTPTTWILSPTNASWLPATDDNEEGDIHGELTYTIDYTVGSGRMSRWNLAQHLYRRAIRYEPRDHRLLRIDTPRLDAPLELVGSPSLNLTFSADASDAAIFVYLEEVDGSNESVYVTEGQVRFRMAQCHSLRPTQPVRHDELLQQENITIELNPVAYRFRRGSFIRVSIAGADADNFTFLRDFDAPSTLTFHAPTTLTLMVMPAL